MIKIWNLFLASILVLSAIVTTEKTINSIITSSYFLTKTKAFYQNVDQQFVDTKADVKQVLVDSNDCHVSGIGTIFHWNQYANSWKEFKDNYSDLDLTVNLNIVFNSYDSYNWQKTSFHIPLNKITVSQTNWVTIVQVNYPTSQLARWDQTHARLSYNCWVNSSDVLIRFKLYTWSSNNYDKYYYSVDTSSVKSNTTFNYDSIKSIFNEKVNNKSLVLDSDYSTSLQDEKNKSSAETALNNLIKGALGDYYERWKPYILPYTYSDKTNQATIAIKFTDLNLKKNILWTFKVPIKFNLTQDFWKKTFEERLTITSGKVIDPNNPNGAMIVDKSLKWNDKDVYGTTAFVRFDANSDANETMKVNGVPIQVLDNQFTFQMTDNQEHETNEYDILLEKHDLNDFNKILGSYEVKYLIKQNIPNLDLIWYAWNPEKNPDQKRLIKPTLPNGEHNPSYDSEVNTKTGTKTQIAWIKHKAKNSFPLDPLDKNGDVIKDDIYDEGFLAEGSVSGMGIIQKFDDSWIKSVQRVKINDKTLQPIGDLETIKSDKDGSYFSLSGTYLYIITDKKGITANKFIIIGQNWQDKYIKFLDVLNESSTAVAFWSTIQGFHLKNYLVKYKSLNSKDITQLSFEQVSSYWKEYVSDVKSQHIESGVDSGNLINLNTISLDAIKMNAKEISIIRSNIISGVTNQLNKYNLEYNVDYQIKDLAAKINQLLEYDSSGNAIVNFTITALDISTKARNNVTLIVRNSKNYTSSKVTDLSKIKFDSYWFNFNQFTTEQLKEWVLKAIENKFKNLNLQLVYQTDYNVSSLDDSTLKCFSSAKEITKLEIIIKAEVLSDLVVNSTSLTLINDLNSGMAPPNPPDSKPDPIQLPLDKSNWIAKQRNLIIMSVIIVVVISSISLIIFFKYRFRKGIGVKK
ncbi:MAG: Mbov_0399 family ICE element protein [Spiroplasma sp.]